MQSSELDRYLQGRAVTLSNASNNLTGAFNGTSSGTFSGTGSRSFSGNFNATSNYQIGGNSVLSTGNYSSNAYVGVQAGDANTQGAANAFVGQQAGYNNNANYNTFLGYQAGYNNTTGSSNIYLGNPGCSSPCTENNTIRIGNQGAGSAQQNTTYIAGINGSTVSSASPVYVAPNGQLGTSNARFQWVYYTYEALANGYYSGTAACSAPYPYLVSGSCGANTYNSASPYIVVNYSGPYTGNGSSNNPSYQANPDTWQCNFNNTDAFQLTHGRVRSALLELASREPCAATQRRAPPPRGTDFGEVSANVPTHRTFDGPDVWRASDAVWGFFAMLQRLSREHRRIRRRRPLGRNAIPVASPYAGRRN